MTNSVRWLDDALKTVRLDFGSIELGRMNAKIDSPTVAMIPMADRDEHVKADHSTGLRSMTRLPVLRGACSLWHRGMPP